MLNSSRTVPGWLHSAAVAAGAVVGSILGPTAVITAYSFAARDAQQIVDFAVRVAEPLAAFGAIAVVALFPARGGPAAGLLRGVAAAAAICFTALWVNDVDMWTYLTASALPFTGVVAALRRSRTSEGRAQARRSITLHDGLSVQALAGGSREIVRTTSYDHRNADHIRG